METQTIELKIAGYEIHAVPTGQFALDGGAMFGTVPKVLWEKSNPADSMNRIPMEARAMLLAFASVGATHFDVTLKDEQSGQTAFDKGRTLNGLTISLTSLLYRAERDGQ